MIMRNDFKYTEKRKPLPKILLVDDKPENLLSLEKVLKSLDAELIKAESGNEALRKTLDHKFALALLDVQMPEMDGYELAEIMREDKYTENIPIIFVSAIYTDRLNVFKGYEKGAFSFITKPFEPRKLLNKVQFFIDKYYTELAYEESRLKYKDLYNSSPDMLVSLDLETGVIKECNEPLLTNTGHKREEVEKMTLLDLFPEKHKDMAEKAIEDFKKDGELRNIELTIQTKTGDTIEILLNARSLRDKKGRLIMNNFSMSDISEVKETREKLKKALHKVKLQNKDLENFVYLISHDLREPMLTVNSFLELLEEEYGKDIQGEARDYVQYSAMAANRMNQLITNLLEYLRVDHSKKREKVDFNQLLEDVIREMQGSFKKANVTIETGELPTLNINENKSKQLFQNLLSNAIKFRKPDEQLEIKVNAKKKDNYWEFGVKDNGIGIPKRQFQKIFHIFKRVHGRDKYEGMGVGLAICKKIVEGYGGEIWPESEEGKGTTFYFTLPEDGVD